MEPSVLIYVAIMIAHVCNNNNNSNFFCANILENQAQWRDKINQSHNRKQCVSRQRMDGKARRLRRIGSIKEIGF